MSLTVKQEKFCQKYIELGNASEAYRQSYKAENMSVDAVKVEASRLLDNPNVALTIAELQKAQQKRHEVTVDTISRELDEARLVALSEKQASAAVSASMGKAKLHGLITEKAENKSDINITVKNYDFGNSSPE